MAKKLNEIQKAFGDLQKKVGDLTDKMTKINTNFWQHNGMLFQGLDAIDERVAELQSKGKKGTTVNDFMDDSDIKAFVKGVDDCKGYCRKESDAYYAEVENLKKVKADIVKLGKATDDVIKARKFKISKSKSALKAISTQIHTFAVDVEAVITEPGPHPSSHKLLN